MALTQAEAAKFTTNMVKRGVLEEIIKNSVILQKLPFIDVVGNAYQYLRENTIGNGNFYGPNEVWGESTPTYSQVTAAIKICGGDADVDEFLKATRSDKTDLAAESIQAKAKGIRHTFLDRFWYGDSTTNTKEFDGVHLLMPTAQVTDQGTGATGAALNLTNLDVTEDLLRDGPPECIISTRAIRRRVRAFLRANGGLYNERFSAWGQQLKQYDETSWEVDDLLTQTETIASGTYSAKTGGATSSIFFLTFGANEGLLGLQNGGLQVKQLGQLESKDAQRTRIKWYVGLALMRKVRVAMIDGVTDAAAAA